MTRPWRLGKLARAAAETESRINLYVDLGLLHRQDDGDFAPDSLRRLRLIQFARSRGFDDDQLREAVRHQGDLLSVFEETTLLREHEVDLGTAARQVGLDDSVVAELSEILEWNDDTALTESDVAAMRVVA